MAEMLQCRRVPLSCILLIPLGFTTRAAQVGRGPWTCFTSPTGWQPWVKDGQKQDGYHVNAYAHTEWKPWWAFKKERQALAVVAQLVGHYSTNRKVWVQSLVGACTRSNRLMCLSLPFPLPKINKHVLGWGFKKKERRNVSLQAPTSPARVKTVEVSQLLCWARGNKHMFQSQQLMRRPAAMCTDNQTARTQICERHSRVSLDQSHAL